MPTRAEVLAVARLARLTFSADEVDRMAADLKGILTHMHTLREIDAGDHPPQDAALQPQDTPLRVDVMGADPLSMPPYYLAPDWRDGFFTVPRLPTHGGRRE